MKMNASMKCALAAVAAGVLALPLIGRAQTTDYSGSYSFDAAKSMGKPEPVSLAGGESPEVAEDGRVGGGGAGAAGGGQPAGGRAARPVDFFKLVVKQTPVEIDLLEGGVALKWKLDGSEDSISGLGRAGYPKGKAAWEGGKLVLTTKQDVYVGKAMFEARTTKDVYTLSGNTLTVDKTETFKGKTETKKLVYTKS